MTQKLGKLNMHMHGLQDDLAAIVKRLPNNTMESAAMHRLHGAARDCYLQLRNALAAASRDTIRKLDAIDNKRPID